MAINWGKAIEAGISTYERLGEEETRQMQRDKMRKDLEQEKALDALYAEKLGRVGKDVSTFTPDTATPETGFYPAGTEPKEALPTGRAGANYVSDSDGMALKETTKQYTSKDAYTDIAREAGIVGGRKGSLEAMQYKSAARASELEDKFDASMKWREQTMFDVSNSLRKTGLSKLPEVINPSLKDHGLKAEYNDKSGIVRILDKSGKVVNTYSDVETAEKAAHAAIGQEWQSKVVGLLGDAKSVVSYMNQREELGIKREQLDVERQYKGEGGVIDRAYSAKSKGFEDKLPEGKKMYLSTIKANTEKLMQIAATDPTPQNTAASQRAQFNLFKTYKDMGMQDIDPYKMSGILPPEQTAAGILGPKNKASQKYIDEQINKFEGAFGKDYANEVRSAIDAKREVKRDSKGEVINEATTPKAAIPVGLNTRQADFYKAKLQNKISELEAETNPRRQSILRAEISKLQQATQ